MKTSYRELDYAYGLAMQKLRKTIGLTQAGLAGRLGVSWRTVAGWEAGSRYPRVEHLKDLIVLAVQQKAFAVGHETEEIRALWKVAHQKTWLDEHWVCELLDQRSGLQEQVLRLEPRVEPEPMEKTMTTTQVTEAACQPQEQSHELLREAGTTGAPSPSLDRSVPQTPSETNVDQPKRSLIVGAGSAQGRVPVSGTLPTTRKRRNLLIYILITLGILAIIGSVGTFFFQARRDATRPAKKTATVQAYPGYLSGHGTFAFFDSLSQEGKWEVGIKPKGGRCQFTGGAYHVSEPPTGFFGWCFSDGIFSNFAFEVQLTIMQGDCGGMTFRDGDRNGYYYFHICQDSTYRVFKYLSYLGTNCIIMKSSHSSVIHTGLGQQNKIAVVASGSTMTYYVNEQQIDQEQDSSYTWGYIGLIAYSGHGHATDVAYSNARLWTL